MSLTEAEAAAWRAERAKNFPSTANVQRKAKEEAERKERGEINLEASALPPAVLPQTHFPPVKALTATSAHIQNMKKRKAPHQAEQRHRRLASVLARQRELGHFEASNECHGVLRSLETRGKRSADQSARGSGGGGGGGAGRGGGRGAKAARTEPAAAVAASAEDLERRRREREAAMLRIFGAVGGQAKLAEEAAAAARTAPGPPHPPPPGRPPQPPPAETGGAAAGAATHDAPAAAARVESEQKPDAAAQALGGAAAATGAAAGAAPEPAGGGGEGAGAGPAAAAQESAQADEGGPEPVGARSPPPGRAAPPGGAAEAGRQRPGAGPEAPREGVSAAKAKAQQPPPSRAKAQQPPPPARKPGGGSLYEKLLSKEIREDRSRLLQALRFVVSRGFFAGEKEPPAEQRGEEQEVGGTRAVVVDDAATAT